MAIETANSTNDAPAVSALRKLPVVDPQGVTINSAGLFRKEVVARLPAGAVADDLKETSLWKRVQGTNGKSLRQHDSVYIIAYDQTWVAEALVSEADATGATLAGVRIVQTPQRARLLFRDSNYAVIWGGGGYFVERLSDGKAMTGLVATEQLAERELRTMYPTRAA